MNCRFFCLILLLVPMLCRTDELRWESDPDQALARATETKRQVLIDFKAQWCRYCRLMEETTLADPVLRRHLAERVRLRIDFERQPAVVAKYSVHTLPTFVLLDADGRELGRLTGYRTTDEFRNWLEQPQAPHADPNDVGESDWQSWSEEEKRSKTSLIMARVIADKRGTGTDAEYAYLTGAVAAEPGLFVEYLQDPRLAMRILTGNLLTQALKNDFGYDPWAGQEEREAAISRLKDHLAGAGQ